MAYIDKGLDENIHFRTSSDFKTLVEQVAKLNHISVSDFFHIMTFEYVKKIPDGGLNFQGIDLKKITQLREKKYLRTIQSLEKSELLSKKLLLKRVGYDWAKLRSAKCTKKDALELINSYLKIVEVGYTEPEDLLEKLNSIKDMLVKCVGVDSIELDNIVNGIKPTIEYKRVNKNENKK